MLDRLKRRIRRPGDQHFSLQATAADLDACYRLLLQRPPDPPGYAFWLQRIAHHRLSLPYLVQVFMETEEFVALHAGNQRFTRLALDDFVIYVSRTDFNVGAAIVRERAYEPQVAQVLRQQLRQGGVFLDIGANIGFFSMLAAALVGPTGSVLAFEPNPDNCLLLQMSARANRFGQIQLHQNAVADTFGVLKLATEGSNGWIAGEHDTMARHQTPFFAQTVPLDAVLGDLPRLDLVKIDIEGAEPAALRGMQGLLERHRPAILTEFSPDMIRHVSGQDAAAYYALLRSYAETMLILEADGPVPAPASYEALFTGFIADRTDHLDLLVQPAR